MFETSRQQIEVEAVIMQHVWNAQAKLKAAMEVNDQYDAALRAGASFVSTAFSGGPILTAVQAVKELETTLIDGKFEQVGETTYYAPAVAQEASSKWFIHRRTVWGYRMAWGERSSPTD